MLEMGGVEVVKCLWTSDSFNKNSLIIVLTVNIVNDMCECYLAGIWVT